jgi:hypothetical protein
MADLDKLGTNVLALCVWLWRPTHVCTWFGHSIQRGSIVSITRDSTWRLECAFKGASPSCDRTVPVESPVGWTELKEGITIKRWEGEGL